MNLPHEFRTALNENTEFMAALNSRGRCLGRGEPGDQATLQESEMRPGRSRLESSLQAVASGGHAEAWTPTAANLFAKRGGLPPECGMAKRGDDSLPTRATLLERLKDPADAQSWEEFHAIYSKLICGVARQSGLRAEEAEDVVQEIMAHAAKELPAFRYDPAVGSFKSWLLRPTRWRIVDQLRKRGPAAPPPTRTDGGGTTFLARVPDPASLELDKTWDDEWKRLVMNQAIANVKRKHDPRKYQIFDLYVNHEMAAEKLAELFHISVAGVYLAKHRVVELLKKEVRRLEREMT